MALNTDQGGAESLALRALAFLAADSDRMGMFLGTYGVDVDQVRARASEPEFLGFVLDHLTSDDALVIAFASAESIDPASVLHARAHLPGGNTPEWT